MLRKDTEAAKEFSALPMIHFMYLVVDSVDDDGCGAPWWQPLNEIYLFGSAPETMEWCHRILTELSRMSID